MTANCPVCNEMDVVALVVALPAARGLPAVPTGTLGTVLEMFTRPCLAYLVEFSGVTDDLMVCVVYPEQLTAFDPTHRCLD